jgi:hypothetical protein
MEFHVAAHYVLVVVHALEVKVAVVVEIITNIVLYQLKMVQKIIYLKMLLNYIVVIYVVVLIRRED